MDIYRACYGMYGLDFLMLGIEPTASGMPGTALPLGHTTTPFSFGDRVLLSSPKLTLNLLCSPRMLQRIVMLQISQNCGCTCDWAHLILFSPAPSFHCMGAAPLSWFCLRTLETLRLGPSWYNQNSHVWSACLLMRTQLRDRVSASPSLTTGPVS